MTMTRRHFVAAGFACGLLAADGSVAHAQSLTGTRATRFRPYNVVVIVLDTSESFQRPSRERGVEGKVLFVEALGVAHRYLAEASKRRERRKEGEDQYYIVAADAASQLIWSGSRQALVGLTADALKDKLTVRKQFANCTDIAGALNAAASIVQEHVRASDKIVLTFSDLVSEPPLDSYSRCAKATGTPPADIRWEMLAEASLGFYFVSKEFAYGRPDKQWTDELARRGLNAKFLDAAQTLTATIDIAPPPPARRRMTDKERIDAEGSVGALAGNLWTVARFALAGLAGFVALVGGAVAVGRFRARSRQRDGAA